MYFSVYNTFFLFLIRIIVIFQLFKIFSEYNIILNMVIIGLLD